MINLLNFQNKCDFSKTSTFQSPGNQPQKNQETDQKPCQVKVLSQTMNKAITVQNFPTFFSKYEPISIIKPLKQKMERVASANYNSKIIKKIIQTNQPDASDNIINKRNNFLNEPQNLINQKIQLSQNTYLSKKFFSYESYDQKPATAGHGQSRSNLKKITNEFPSQPTSKDFMNFMDFDEGRAKTALNNRSISDKNIQPSGKVYTSKPYVSKTNFPYKQDTYESFKVNNDVKAHMKNYLRRPESQFNISRKTPQTQNSQRELTVQTDELPSPHENQIELKLTDKIKDNFQRPKPATSQGSRMSNANKNQNSVQSVIEPQEEKKKTYKQVGMVKFDISLKPPKRNYLPKMPGMQSPMNCMNECAEPGTFNKQDMSIQDEMEEDFKGLDLQFEGMTAKEKNYIVQQRQVYAKDLENDLDKYTETDKETRQALKELQVVKDGDKNFAFNFQSEDMSYCEIIQIPIDEQLDFFEHPNNIRDELRDVHTELQQKFDEQAEFDIMDNIRMQKQTEHMLEYLKVRDELLTEYELNYILEQYKLDANDRNYDNLDQITQKLSFFKKYSRPTRIYLMKLGNILRKGRDEIIIRQGDEGDQMYIILKGACHVRVQRKNIRGELENPVVKTLYDGLQFGELALMNAQQKPTGLADTLSGQPPVVQTFKDVQSEIDRQAKEQKLAEEEARRKGRYPGEEEKLAQNFSDMLLNLSKTTAKRGATVEAAESTILLSISRDYFNSILLNMLQKELDVKIKALQLLPCFYEFNSISLMPLANLIELKTFKLGEIILREGDKARVFSIITKGRGKIVKEEIIVRDTEVLGVHKSSKKKRLKFGKDIRKFFTLFFNPPPSTPHPLIFIVHKKQTTQNQKKKVSQATITPFDSSDDSIDFDDNTRDRCDNYKFIMQDDNKFAYNYHYDFGSLVRGDCFMGRSLVAEFLKVNPLFQKEVTGNPELKAKLTIVSDSACTQMYSIERSLIHLVPEYLIKQLISYLSLKKDFDDSYQDNVQDWIKKWDSYKVNLIKGCIDMKKVKKNLLFK